jgi:hypothetical protein
MLLDCAACGAAGDDVGCLELKSYRPYPLSAEWAVPLMLRVVSCLHALYTPAGRQALAPLAAALEMAPQERALYLRRQPGTKASSKVGAVGGWVGGRAGWWAAAQSIVMSAGSASAAQPSHS